MPFSTGAFLFWGFPGAFLFWDFPGAEGLRAVHACLPRSYSSRLSSSSPSCRLGRRRVRRRRHRQEDGRGALVAGQDQEVQHHQ